MRTQEPNQIIAWSGGDYIPLIYLCKNLNVCPVYAEQMLARIDPDTYGMCNYAGILERDLAVYFDDYINFQKDSDQERLCIDKTIAYQFVKEMVDGWFNIVKPEPKHKSHLRLVK